MQTQNKQIVISSQRTTEGHTRNINSLSGKRIREQDKMQVSFNNGCKLLDVNCSLL
jgi:hypothetical protein